MKKMRKISIIIPVYNVEQFLKCCINSVISQTYQNIEIILVNDGSTDGSYSICQEYAKKDSRIKLVSQANGGLSKARNKGIEIATGDFITFIDSDDYVSKNYIEYLYAMIDNDILLAACMSKVVFQQIDNDKEGFCKKNYIEYLNVPEYCIRSFGDVKYLAAWGKLYHRSLFETVRFPEGKLHEDIYIMADIITKVDRIALGSQKNYYYLKRKDSITTTAFNENKFQLIESNRRFVSKIVAQFPELKIAADVYQIHARSSLLKQININEKNYYASFISETIHLARNTCVKACKENRVKTFEKVLCIITSTNFYLIKVAWYLFDKISGKGV